MEGAIVVRPIPEVVVGGLNDVDKSLGRARQRNKWRHPPKA